MPSLQPGERRPCRACGTPIIGARSGANPSSVLPVVLEPHPNGNVLLQQKDGVPTGFVFSQPLIRQALLDAGVVMRVNHFADCPGREQFERKSAAARAGDGAGSPPGTGPPPAG